MEHINNINEVYQVLAQNVLAIPGVASIPKDDKGKMRISINKNALGWAISININCFSYVNIWSVIRQVQVQAKYSLEKLNQHKEHVEVNINVFDLILEDSD